MFYGFAFNKTLNVERCNGCCCCLPFRCFLFPITRRFLCTSADMEEAIDHGINTGIGASEKEQAFLNPLVHI